MFLGNLLKRNLTWSFISMKPDEAYQLKQEIEQFLSEIRANPKIAYHVRNQLGVQTDMPYYRDPNKGKKNRLGKLSIIYEISNLLAQYQSPIFTRKILKELAKNQGQALRGLSKKSKFEGNRRNMYNKDGVWEHPVTIKYIRDTIIQYIDHNQMEELEQFLHWIENNTYQIFLTKEEDAKLNSISLKSDMPSGWDWKSGDIFIRYKLASIRKDLYS